MKDSDNLPENTIKRGIVFEENIFTVKVLLKRGCSWIDLGIGVTVDIKNNTIYSQTGEPIGKWHNL